MKKVFLTILVVLVTVLCAFAGDRRGDFKNIHIFSGNGVQIIGTCTEDGIDYSEERKMNSFESLECSGPFNVYYVQSKESKVLVEGNQASVEALETNVVGKTLKVRIKDGKYSKLVLRVTVYSPELNHVSKSGSGSFTDNNGHKTANDLNLSSSGSCRFVVDKIECGEFNVATSGSGRMEAGSLKCEDASFSISGSGRMEFANFISTGDVAFRISGSGNFNAENMQVDGDLDLRISGSGKMSLNGEVKGTVSASTSGSGNISGNLKTGGLETHISGSGSIRFSK